MPAPELQPHEGSWVVTHLDTAQQREFFRSQKGRVDWFADHPEQFEVKTIGQHLAGVQADA